MKRSLTLVPALAVTALAMPKYAGYISAILMIAVIIFLHELGHFLAAKWMGMPVETFSLGFGTRLVGFKWRETDVRLSLLPLGGYVKLAGYNPEEPEAEDPHGFLQQPFGKRMLFYSGGVLANIATAFLLFTAMCVHEAGAVGQSSPLLVGSVTPGMAAAQAGVHTGDLIKSIGDLKFPGSQPDEFAPYVSARAGQVLDLTLERDGQALALKITPSNVGGSGKLGIGYSPTQRRYDPHQLKFSDFVRAPYYGALSTKEMAWQVIKGLGQLVSGRASFKQMGGPITIVKVASQQAQEGWIGFFGFMAFISINLAVLNALPLPMLDGGHMAILLFEKLRRKDLSIEMKEKILTAGFFLLASLMVMVFALDFWKMRH